MPAEFETGFFVREPAWHSLGTVLDHYPGREEAMQLAGHDFDLIALDHLRVEIPNAVLEQMGQPVNLDGSGFARRLQGYKALVKSTDGSILHVARDSYEAIPNSVAYDFAEELLGQGFKYETGITLKGGALCALTLYLNEPIQITGDNSTTLPYLGLSWSHDGSGALRGRSTSVRQVCANTVAASEAEGARLGTDFSIRHTKNWRSRVEDARKAMQGVRSDLERYTEEMEALAAVEVSASQRETFTLAMAHLAAKNPIEASKTFEQEWTQGQVTDRVRLNVTDAQQLVRSCFNSNTIPEAHRFTAYGLHLAGIEYLDHLRDARSSETRVARSLLRDEPAKKKMRAVIRELTTA